MKSESIHLYVMFAFNVDIKIVVSLKNVYFGKENLMAFEFEIISKMHFGSKAYLNTFIKQLLVMLNSS